MLSPPVNVSIMRTGPRRISASTASFITQESPVGTEGNNEGDSNADTCCLGTNFLVLAVTNRTAEVFPCDPSYEPIANVPIVTVLQPITTNLAMPMF